MNERRETPWDHEPRPAPEVPGTLSTRAKAIAGAFVAILYAAGMIARGEVLPGIVGGVLGGIVCFLVLREVERQRRERRRGRGR